MWNNFCTSSHHVVYWTIYMELSHLVSSSSPCPAVQYKNYHNDDATDPVKIRHLLMWWCVFAAFRFIWRCTYTSSCSLSFECSTVWWLSVAMLSVDVWTFTERHHVVCWAFVRMLYNRSLPGTGFAESVLSFVVDKVDELLTRWIGGAHVGDRALLSCAWYADKLQSFTKLCYRTVN